MPRHGEKLYYGARGSYEVVGSRRWRVEMIGDPDSALLRHLPDRPVHGIARFRVIDSLPMPVLVSINLPDPVTGSPDGGGGHADIIPREAHIREQLRVLVRERGVELGTGSWFWDNTIPVTVTYGSTPYYAAIKATIDFVGSVPLERLPVRLRGRPYH